MAATRTPGIRKEVQPYVFQASLQDFYVEYTLAFALERQDQRVNALAALHANVQDLFNEYGVQIMSPHYLGDPAAPKVVPADKWFAAPARKKEVSTR
jgi:small-conductance mechanosensitive channel